MRRRFELSKSPVDGLIRKWEQRMASSLTDLSTGEPLADPEHDYPIQVVTGVFRRRKDVFKEMEVRQ